MNYDSKQRELKELRNMRMISSVWEFELNSGSYMMSPFRDILKLKFGATDADIVMVDTVRGPMFQVYILTGNWGEDDAR